MANKIIGFVNLYDSPSLGELTKHRALGSTSFLGRFALMDFALSNFTNAGIDDINVLVKNNFRSISKHCGSLKSWITNTKNGNCNLLINEKGISDSKYNSDLNAIRENDWVFYDANSDYVIIQPAHIVTSIDLEKVLKFHIDNNAEITVVTKEISNGNKAFLSSYEMILDGNQVVSCKENDGSKKKLIVSLRTYIFSHAKFEQMLNHKDFRDAMSLRMVIQKVINEGKLKVLAYKHVGYARCFDSFENFVKYSFELLDYEVAKELFRKDYSIYTNSRNTPPANYAKTSIVKNSYIANGAVVAGKVENSIISRYVEIEEGAQVKNSIILTKTKVSSGVKIENAFVDKYSQIRKDVKGSKNKIVYIAQGKVVK